MSWRCGAVEHALKNEEVWTYELADTILPLNIGIKQTLINEENIPEQGKLLPKDLRLHHPRHDHLALTRPRSDPLFFRLQQETENHQVIESQIAPENQNIRNWGRVHSPFSQHGSMQLIYCDIIVANHTQINIWFWTFLKTNFSYKAMK